MKKIISTNILLLAFLVSVAQERVVTIDFESGSFVNQPNIPFDKPFGIVGNASKEIEFVKVNILRAGKDKVLHSIGQKDMQSSSTRQLVLDEVVKLYQSPKINEIMIIGGEPFLYLDLHKLVSTVPDHLQVSIFSGLGVNEKRFAHEIKKLPKNAKVIVSAESVGPLYDCVRYGNTWQRFINNLDQLKNAGISYEFNCTVSNLTVVGLKEFVDWAGTVPLNFQACTDPSYLSVGVLDPATKVLVRSNTSGLPKFVVPALDIEPDQTQINNFKIYVREFAKRRQLKFSVFPKSLENWIMT
jgi:hypothetical protein